MKNRVRFFRWIVLSVSMSWWIKAPVQAAKNSGTSSFSFLNIPTGARAAGMGQAFVSVPNDVQGLVYNPASLATLAASQVSFEHLSYVEDVVQEGLAAGHAGRDRELSWGMLVNYLHVGDIDRTVATLGSGASSGEGFTEAGSFSTYDMALGGSIAGPFLMEGMSIGSTVKFLRESLGDAASNGAAVDLGLIYQGNVERSWNIGASIQNVGFATKFADAAVKLPLTFRAGVSGQPFAQWLFATDYVRRNDTDGEIDVGAEVTPKKFFSMRVGYRYAFQSPDLGGISNFSAGFGLRRKLVSLDYALVPLGDLGMTHRVSLNFRFKTHRS